MIYHLPCRWSFGGFGESAGTKCRCKSSPNILVSSQWPKLGGWTQDQRTRGPKKVRGFVGFTIPTVEMHFSIPVHSYMQSWRCNAETVAIHF